MNATERILNWIGDAKLKEASRLVVKFKKLNPDAPDPYRAHPTDAGFDLTAVSVAEDTAHNCVSYGTGIATEIPEGYVGLLFPRSSVYKQDLALSNAVGVIDCHYRGEIMFKFRHTFPNNHKYHIGDRIGQMVVIPIPSVDFVEVDELSESDRGEGGYGSSGK